MKGKRKGFTLVELLVVIAILAILAMVSIVGYTAFTRKAAMSNDEAIITQMNNALKGYEALDEKARYPHQAVQQCIENGFIYQNLKAESKNHKIVYDVVSNRFALANENGKIVFADKDTKEDSLSFNFFECVDVSLAKETFGEGQEEYNGHSLYLFTTNKESTEVDSSWNAIEVNTGIDTGLVTGVNSISYVNNGDGQTVVIRTNSVDTALTINGPSDDVKHYGVVGDLTITAVDPDDCYYEYGFVCTLVSFGSGKFVVCESAQFHQTMDAVRRVFQENEGTSEAPDWQFKDGVTYEEGTAPQYAQHKWDENGVCEYGNCTGGANGGRAVSDTHVHDFSNGDCLCGEPEPSLLIMNYGDLYNFAHDLGNFADVTESKLGANFDVPNKVDFCGVKILDLNGFKITGTIENYSDIGHDQRAVLYVSESGNLTINDSIGGGSIQPQDEEGIGTTTFAVYNYGNLTINAGEFTGGHAYFEMIDVHTYSAAVASSDASKTILNGGTFINLDTNSDKFSVSKCTINKGSSNNEPKFSHEPKDSIVQTGYIISKTGEFYTIVPE